MPNERWRKRLLGNRTLSPETLMMGYGYDPVPVGAVAEAAGLSHLDLRLPHRPGRQGFLRTGLWPAPEAAERGAGPHLQPDQQSRPRNARGPAGDLGRGRGQPRVRLGHGRDLDHALGLCAAGLGHRSFGPRLRRHGLSLEADPAAIRRDAGRLPGGGRSESDGGGGRQGARNRTGRRALSRDAGQSDQRPRRHRPRPAIGREPRRRRRQGARWSSSTTPCSDPCTRRRSPTAPISS